MRLKRLHLAFEGKIYDLEAPKLSKCGGMSNFIKVI